MDRDIIISLSSLKLTGRMRDAPNPNPIAARFSAIFFNFRPKLIHSDGFEARSLRGYLRWQPGCDTNEIFKFAPKGQA